MFGTGSSRRWLWGSLLVFAALMFGLAQPAQAHPLGNFTINLYSRLEVGTDRIDIIYIVDMAEIPTYQEFAGKQLDAQAQAEYLAQAVSKLGDGLRLLVDGRKQKLSVTSQAISFPPGQGSLATTRIEVRLDVALPKLSPGTQRDISYEDSNYADRLGWHEVVVQSLPGTQLVRSDVPTSDRSNELRTYPQDMLSSPPNVRTAHAVVEPGGGTRTDGGVPLALRSQSTDRFAALVSTAHLTPLVLVLTLLAALGLGAAHALSPGHGKTVVAAYLIGSRGTARHALFLGLTVTATHTIGVFALGLVTLFASRYVLPEQLYPWLGVLSGGLVAMMGLTLLRQRLRAIMVHAIHDHDHPDHAHDLAHHHPQHSHTHTYHTHESHAHDHAAPTHTHLPPGADGAPITWHSLLALGISGGLVPCPSALVVMLSAIALGRVGFGLLLIVAFSLGLAGVLTTVGIVFVHGARWLSRISHGRHQRIGSGLRLIPIISALVVTIAGVLITTQAIVQAGLLR